MELTYSLTREDHQRGVRLSVARVKQHVRHVSGWGLQPIVLTWTAALLGVAPLLLFAEFASPFAYSVAIWAYMWGAIFVWLFGWSMRRLFMNNWLPDNSPSLSEVRLKLASDGVEASDQLRTSKYAWQAFSEVSQSGDLVILWFDRAQALLVPDRAFSSEDMRQAFINTVRGHLAPTSAPS